MEPCLASARPRRSMQLLTVMLQDLTVDVTGAVAGDSDGLPGRCSICLDRGTDSMTTDCGHRFCAGCVSRHISLLDLGQPPLCPNCRGRIRTLTGDRSGVPGTFIVRYNNVLLKGLWLSRHGAIRAHWRTIWLARPRPTKSPQAHMPRRCRRFPRAARRSLGGRAPSSIDGIVSQRRQSGAR